MSDPLLRLFAANAWRWTCGLREYETERVPGLDALRVTEFPLEFARGMRDRLIMGRMRYGEAQSNPPGRGLALANERIQHYTQTGKIEYLLDAANGLLLEWVARRKDGAELESVNDDGYFKG